MTEIDAKSELLLRLDQVVVELSADSRSEHAWDELLNLTWPFTFGMAHRRLTAPKNFSDADDLAQSAYMRLATAWHGNRVKAQNGRTVLALLATIVERLSVDVLRKEKRMPHSSLSTHWEFDLANKKSVHLDVEINDLVDCISTKLDPTSQKVITHRLEGFKSIEIASICGISERSVERVLAELRGVLRAYFDVED